MVESGEYERVFAAEVEPGDMLAAYDDAEVTETTSRGERVTLAIAGVGSANYGRGTTLLVKVFPPSLWEFSEAPGRTFGPYRDRDDAREAFQRVLGFWPESTPRRETYTSGV